MADIDKLCGKYIAGSLVCVALLTIAALLVEKLQIASQLACPVAVSAVFSIVVETADALVWRWVAKKSPDGLTTFYTAVSGFRMLLALATMFVCYLIVGRNAVAPYIIVMMVYYFVLLAHHSIFFSRLSNGGKLNINNK